MSGSGIGDWQNVGVFPLQDHDDGVDVARRLTIAGMRVGSMDDAKSAGSAEDTAVTIAQDDDKGTLGDIHPWVFWQTADRDERGMGSWSMAWLSSTVGGGGGGFGNGKGTGQKNSLVTVLPMRSKAIPDDRYVQKAPYWSPGLPVVPRGVMALTMPGTHEGSQEEHLVNVDPRLFAPNVGGPAEAGTIVVDLQPDNEPCMDGSQTPGIGGRHARLQSMMRVVAIPKKGINKLKTGIGNALAWNLALSDQDELAGYGMVWAKLDSGGGGRTGPITQPPGRTGPITQAAGSGESGRASGFAGGESAGDGKFGSIHEWGKFQARPKGGHGIAFMANKGACGPFHAGHAEDQHQIGVDRDGNPMNSGHLSTNAYFYRSKKEDGPLFFEGDYPDPMSAPLKVKTHLTWDKGASHKWIDGGRSGMWKWWTEVPFCCPNGDPPWRRHLPPKTPKTPSTPGVPGPTTPRPPGPGNPGKPTPSPPKTPGGGGGRNGPITPPAPPSKPPRGGGWKKGPTTGAGGGDGPGFPGGATGGGAPPPVKGRKGPITGGELDQGPPTDFGPPIDSDLTPGVLPLPPIGRGDGTPYDDFGNGEPELGDGTYAIDHVVPKTDVVSIPHVLEEFSGNDPGDPESGRGAVSDWHGVIERVGEIEPDSTWVYSIHHPMAETFTQIGFRPELMVAGYPSFRHNPQFSDMLHANDETARPFVLSMATWGGQTADGDWDYTVEPEDSLVRGGMAMGGALYHLPKFTLEDYLGINSTVDVTDYSTTAYVMAAPGVAYALGTPTSAGGLNAKSVIIGQDTATGTNHPLAIYQLSALGAPTTLLHGELDQATSEVLVSVGGNQGLRLPRGSGAQRPSAFTLTGGEIRVNNDAAADVVEFYDAGSAAWTSLGAGGGGGVTDHGALTGLADDDHTHYHNDARGDARYRTSTILASVSNGEGASLIGIEDSGALYTATTVEGALAEVSASVVTAHGSLTGLTSDDHTQYLLADGTRAMSGQLDMSGNDVVDARSVVVGSAAASDPAIIFEVVGAVGGVAFNTDTGRFGIGTTTPSTALDVSGSITVSGDVDGVDVAALKATVDALGGSAVETGDLINASTGAGDAGKPIKLDAAGHLDASMINDSDIDHGSIGGLGDDDHTQYLLASGARAMSGALAMGSNKITGLTAGNAAGEAMEVVSAVATFLAKSGGTMSADINMGGNDVVNVGQIGIGTATPDASALIQMTSTTQGLGIPAMTTTQRNAISSPIDGLMIWNTSTGMMDKYDTFVSAWSAI